MITTTQTLTTNIRFHGGTNAGSRGALTFDHVVHTALLWMARPKQRRHLSNLSTNELDDIGISAKAAATEATKPFWRV
jgi:uncharacterized protein YjiS (DUF1127 family)